MKNLKYLPLLIFLIIFSSLVLADQRGSVSILYLSNETGCLQPFTGNFTPGDNIYVKLQFTNTGTEDLINAKTFIIDTFQDNYGYYTTANQYFDLHVGESITFCFPYTTYKTYKPGRWTGWVYFRNYNNIDICTRGEFYFNMTSHPTVPYELVGLNYNITSGMKIPPSQGIDFWVDITNKNNDAPFSGRFFLGWLTFIDTGLTEKYINLQPSATQRFFVRFNGLPEPRQENFGTHVDGSQSQDNIRKWPSFYIDGPYYQARIYQLYSNQSVYAKNEEGYISVKVRNTGNTAWDTSCTYKFNLTGRKDSSSSWLPVYSQSFNFPENHAPNTDKWYNSSVFKNSLDFVLSEFYIYFYVFCPPGKEVVYTWEGRTVYYSPDIFPDVTDSCSSQIYEKGSKLLEKLTCPAAGNPVIFVKKPQYSYLGLDSIKATSGSLTLWWEGERDGSKGFFIRGSTDANYEIVFWLLEIMEMDTFLLTLPILILSVILFLLLHKN